MELKFPYTLEDVYKSAGRKRFTVISTFSGGGGSSIGYKLVGGDVLLANEFVKTAYETYCLNFPETPVIISDIKLLNGKDFLDKIGINVGDIDILDGSPPCSAYSMAGKREKNWGKSKKYSDDKIVENIEDLFFEFIRIAGEIQPKIIITENVEGLQMGESIKKLNQIINKFSSIGYIANYKTVNAKNFGVAQNRPRTIIIAIRNDIFDKSGNFFPTDFFPEYLNKPYRVLSDVLSTLEQTELEIQQARDICKQESVINKVIQSFPYENRTNSLFDINYADATLTKNHTAFFSMRKTSWNLISPCLTATVTLSGAIHPLENRKFSLKESYRIMGLPDDYKNTGTYIQQLERVGRMHSPFSVAYIADHIVRRYLNV
jgi:DNA (cytosine-5)-methyltransferase 1